MTTNTKLVLLSYLFLAASSTTYRCTLVIMHWAQFFRVTRCTYLMRLETRAVSSKSRWLGKTFFMTHPETLQWRAEWNIHKFFPCLSWAAKECVSYMLLKQYTHLDASPKSQMHPSWTSAAQRKQVHILWHRVKRLEIRTTSITYGTLLADKIPC